MDNRQMSHEPMEFLEEYVDVSREMEHNPLMTLKAESQTFKDMEDAFKRALETLEQKNKENVDQLTIENQILKHLLSNLHKYATTLPELDDSVFEQSSTLKPDSPESNLYQQTQDIYNKLKEIREIESFKAEEQRVRGMEDSLRMAKESIEHKNKELQVDEHTLEDTLRKAIENTEQQNEGHIHELENENQILKKLLRDLHMCATSNTDIKNTPFELSDTVKSNPFVASAYHHAHDIYTQLKQTKEIESELESAGKQLFKLLSVILGDEGHHKMVTTGREKGTKAASESVLIHPDKHNENFQLALSELEQMKQKSRECETLDQRLNEVNETVLKSESDMIGLNNAWRQTYLMLQQDKERELQEITTKWINYCKEVDQYYLKEKEQLLHSVEILKTEKDELLTRLSKIAADRLQHGNVDIADLSDPDRPTKLQDVYSELYDNEWTDAFEELIKQRNVSETYAIRMLLDILMCSFRMCREITWGRYERLKNVLASVDIAERNPFSSAMKVMNDVPDPGLVNQEQNTREQFGNNNEIENQNVAKESEELLDPNMGASSKNKVENGKEMRFGCTLDLDISLEKQIKDIWRTTTMALKENAIRQLSSAMETCLDIQCRLLPMTSKYLMICIDICWKMGVQEKPLHLDCVAEKGVGAEKWFDNGKFRTYTRSGENVDFVVWPALFLYEGGPMLVKGVAQGCSSKEKENNAIYV